MKILRTFLSCSSRDCGRETIPFCHDCDGGDERNQMILDPNVENSVCHTPATLQQTDKVGSGNKKKTTNMPSLLKIEGDLSRDGSPSSVAKPDSAPVSSSRPDAPKLPSEHPKKRPLGILDSFPQSDTRKRKEAKRVTASPGALSLQKLPAMDIDAARSPTKRPAALDRAASSSDEDDDARDGNDSPSSKDDRKRHFSDDFSDIENAGDGGNDRGRRIARKKRIGSIATTHLDIETSATDPATPASKLAVYGLQSSSEEEGWIRPARSVVTKPRNRRTGSASRYGGQSGWLASFHATNDDDSSSSSSEDEDDDTDRKLKSIGRCDWLASPSRDDKLHFLDAIDNVDDELLQMLLWDIGFDYNLQEHQFEAARFVAGFVRSFPRPMTNQADESAGDRKDKAIQEMLQRNEIGRIARKNALRRGELKLRGRGVLLADEMGQVFPLCVFCISMLESYAVINYLHRLRGRWRRGRRAESCDQ